MKKIICLILCMVLAVSATTITVFAQQNNNSPTNDEVFVQQDFVDAFNKYVKDNNIEQNYGLITTDKKSWFLNYIGTVEDTIVFRFNGIIASPTNEIIGDYYVTSPSLYCQGIDNDGGYFVYKNSIVYSLKQAYSQGIVKMEDVAQLCPADVIVLNGDVNKDKSLSIQDVTALQKHLVLSEEQKNKNLANITALAADFNGDKSIDIKDATAIQKKLAEVAE